jgi:hypothetical protein
MKLMLDLNIRNMDFVGSPVQAMTLEEFLAQA